MGVEDVIVSRVEGLIDDAAALVVVGRNSQAALEAHRQKCSGWLASALNVIELVCLDPNTSYRRCANDVVSGGVLSLAAAQVGEVRSILEGLLIDLKAGLVSSVANRARAEILDDFLDQGEYYFKRGQRMEAGVIAGVVFEDTLRRICRKRQVSEKGVDLDQLISTLAKSTALSGTKAKRARAAADVRTKATHAQWGDFDLGDVEATIKFTRELISIELDR